MKVTLELEDTPGGEPGEIILQLVVPEDADMEQPATAALLIAAGMREASRLGLMDDLLPVLLAGMEPYPALTTPPEEIISAIKDFLHGAIKEAAPAS